MNEFVQQVIRFEKKTGNILADDVNLSNPELLEINILPEHHSILSLSFQEMKYQSLKIPKTISIFL